MKQLIDKIKIAASIRLTSREPKLKAQMVLRIIFPSGIVREIDE